MSSAITFVWRGLDGTVILVVMGTAAAHAGPNVNGSAVGSCNTEMLAGEDSTKGKKHLIRLSTLETNIQKKNNV